MPTLVAEKLPQTAVGVEVLRDLFSRRALHISSLARKHGGELNERGTTLLNNTFFEAYTGLLDLGMVGEAARILQIHRGEIPEDFVA